MITVRLSAVARTIHTSFGETRRSLGEGGKPDTTEGRAEALRYPPSRRTHIASARQAVDFDVRLSTVD
jgi:hypothetical protein